MKNVFTIFFILILAAIFGVFLCSFGVRQTQLALVTTFGKPNSPKTAPGWYFRWPSPIEKVIRFDSRQRTLEADLSETTTKGAIPVIVNTYVVWRIKDPLVFYNAVRTVDEAENKLRTMISDVQNKVIGQYMFSEFVNSDKSKTKFSHIQKQMFDSLKTETVKNYGIEVTYLGIKQLKVSKDVSAKVFDRMISERERITKNTLSEGQAQATKIMVDADTKEQILLDAAMGRAKTIKGEGDAAAAKYYELLKDDPEFAMFLRNIEALKKVLADRTTLILNADSEPFELLKNKPQLNNK